MYISRCQENEPDNYSWKNKSLKQYTRRLAADGTWDSPIQSLFSKSDLMREQHTQGLGTSTISGTGPKDSPFHLNKFQLLYDITGTY